MKNKTAIGIAAIAVLIAAVIAVVIYNNQSKQPDGAVYGNIEDAAKNASFKLDYPDRLCGIPATEFQSNSSTVEVRYGSENYIRKTLGVTDNSGVSDEYGEVSEQVANGMNVTFKGNGGLVYLAVWNDNNFAYTISVSEGVSVEEMTEYIESTR